MLNQKICLVDFSEQFYSINGLYTQVMPRAQLDLLYLATALAVRPHQLTILSDCEQAHQEAQIQFLPLPADPERFWATADFDIVICVNSLEGSTQIRPWLPSRVPLVLWTHLPPRHVAMLPLQHESVREAWTAFVFDSFYLAQSYHDLHGVPSAKCHYRWPVMVRSLRKRFNSSEQLLSLRQKKLTMAFTASPAYGLGQTLEIFQALKQDFPELQLRVLLKPGCEEAEESPSTQELIQLCRQTADVEVCNPLPWPSYAEKLVGCHLLCHPLSFQDLSCSETIDALSAGCLSVACEHPGLQEIFDEQVDWIPADPAEDYFDRYRAALAKWLHLLQSEPEQALRRVFGQIARFNTYNTWDLRVWEWESMLYEVVGEKQPA